MENLPSELDLKNLVAELSQGRELAKQLWTHLNAQSSSSSYENRDLLLQRILYSYDHALSMLAHARPGGAEVAPPMAMSDSPRSLAGSPGSDDSDQDPASRKRKAVPRWNKKIKVSPEAGIEGQLDDGYGWRKYGQKDILGAKYPRGYYRCTYRHAQGCLATKQVQRSDDDPITFEITYRRKHTCNQRADAVTNVVNPPAPTPDPQNGDPNPLTRSPKNEPPFNIQTSLRVITQDLGPNENPSFQPFNFSSSSSINPQNNHIFPYGDIMGDYNPISSNDNDDYGGLIPNLLISDSELSPIFAAITSTTNSPTIGTDFPFGSGSGSGFGSNFTFGDPGYHP